MLVGCSGDLGDARLPGAGGSLSMNYALREALRLVIEEGLEVRFERHRQNARMLWDGLQALGLDLLVPEKNRLPRAVISIWLKATANTTTTPTISPS